MRAWLLVMIAVAAFVGCNALDGYIYESVHFKHATVIEQEFTKSPAHLLRNLRSVMTEREIGEKSFEETEENIEVRGSHNGREYVFDISKLSDKASRIHMEIDQPGNDGILWSLCRDLESLP